MPRCYQLSIAAGSSLDQHTQNVSLFNLVEHVAAPAVAWERPGELVPVELHAYFRLSAEEVGRGFEIRFFLESPTGLETYSDVFPHRSNHPRYRTRTMGLPLPALPDDYVLGIEWRWEGTEEFQREPIQWPVAFTRQEPRTAEKPRITH